MGTLVVNEIGCQLGLQTGCLIIRKKKAILRRIRLQEVTAILLVGKVEITASAIFAAFRLGIPISWISRAGKYLGSLSGPTMAISERWIAQFRATQNPQLRLRLMQSFVKGKIQNQRTLLLRAQRRLKDERIAEALARMRLSRNRLEEAATPDEVRGYEGAAAAAYFSVFGRTIANPLFQFNRRNRRPPRDPVNACLSFGYAFLATNTEAIVRARGLLPAIGFLHEPLRGRPSLVLDLMEEFRPVAVDALILRLLNRRQLTPGDFHEFDPNDPDGDALDLPPTPFPPTPTNDNPLLPPIETPPGPHPPSTGLNPESHRLGITPTEPAAPSKAVYLGKTGRKIFISAWLSRLREPISLRNHGKITLQKAIELQVDHLIRLLEGTDEHYFPIEIR